VVCGDPRQITEAFPWDTAPKYLIRDIDPAFGGAFKARVRVYPVWESVAVEDRD
jgi:hypothetical protein